MSVIGLIIILAIWNWLGGVIAGFIPLSPFVWRSLKNAQANPDDEDAARRYLRWLATNHLFNHVVTVAGSFLLCLGAIDDGAPSWMAWGVFAIYFLFMRLGHIIEAAARFVKADAMPVASNM